MYDNDSKTSNPLNVAQVVVISVFCTVVIFLGIIIAFRDTLTNYLVSQITPSITNLVPEVPAIVSNEEQVVQAIAKVNPAVVSIIITKDVPTYEQYFETIDPWGWFGGFSIPRVRENGTEEREVGGGSGFIVSTDGLIVTNRHVVDDESARYSVIMTDGSAYDVAVVDRDEQLDIAILKLSELPEERLPVVSFGDSENLQLGQTVIAIGNALAEFQNSVSVGVVSGLGRSITASDSVGNFERLSQVIQTDAAINPGNSGGPLLNLAGEVVGVNVATSQGADNIGFALPAHVVKQVVDSVREHGEIVRPFLGVRYVMLDEVNPADYGSELSFGALLYTFADDYTAVEPGSPADTAGLQSGDVIISIDGESLLGQDLATLLRKKKTGANVEIIYIRDGDELRTNAVLTDAP